MPRLRTLLITGVAWTIGAVSSVGIGLVALTMIGTGISGAPLSHNAPIPVVGVDPSEAPAPTATPSPTTSAAAGTNGTISTGGGTIIVQCRQSVAYLVAWSPAPGYRPDDVQRGPAALVGVTFEGASEFHVSARCVGGSPQPTIRDDTRDGGHD
jgi:hypothetical protein